MACWTCGLVQEEKELQVFTCKDCGEGSGLQLRRLGRGAVKADLGIPLLDELTKVSGPGVGLNAVVVLHGQIARTNCSG